MIRSTAVTQPTAAASQTGSKVFEDVKLDEALKRVPIPPHPGALMYYKEMNVPGWENYEDLLPEG